MEYYNEARRYDPDYNPCMYCCESNYCNVKNVNFKNYSRKCPRADFEE